MVGSQIRGATITEALAVSVVDAEAIEIMGVDSGDELLQHIPEQGQNFFNEAENISGGVNSGRGDVGAFNLRSVGSGNTLVLLNGRRLVNSATYQTEEIGGSFVPVNTVNSNSLPVRGLARVEVLRDGASAIYGADAVAGVVNNVLKTDFEGFDLRLRYSHFANFPGNRLSLSGSWGTNFNQGRSNVAVYASYFNRDRINSTDDSLWADSDFRHRLPDDSPWKTRTSFRNDTANSEFPQLDIIPSLGSSHSLRAEDYVDSAGEFETYPLGDARCDYQINATTCGHEDGQNTYRHNYNSAPAGPGRDLASDLTRLNFFVTVNHEFGAAESFTELLYYSTTSNLIRHASGPFSHIKLELGKSNPHNPFGGGPGRLSGPEHAAAMADVPDAGYDVLIDNYRFTQAPRIVDNDGSILRLLQGFRGSLGDWDWDSAFSWSKATKDDVTHNRISNSMAQEALNASDAAIAFNPLDPTYEGSNIERLLIDVYRNSETELTTLDAKFTNGSLFNLPGGNAGLLVGMEWRDESFADDRDPRLDGTIQFTDRDGDTFPFISDVVNSSPTPDNEGSRTVTSLFAELQLPLHDTLNVQVALRHERFSDIDDDATVPKLAFGYRPVDWLLLRGSWSQSYRAPNLITVNEAVVSRSNTRDDWACHYALDTYTAANPDARLDLDCEYSIVRTARGSDQLVSESADNLSYGIVLEPVDGLTFTVDFWEIEKEDTIGLFGEENHTLLDLLNRLEAGDGNCSQAVGNARVVRIEPDDDQTLAYEAAGLCPAGNINRVEDVYQNLDTLLVKGYDLGVYYDVEAGPGAFRIKYNGSFLDTYQQDVAGQSAALVSAQADGRIPDNYPIAGFADLIGRDGNQDERHSLQLSYSSEGWRASLSAYRIGSFYQSSLTLADGTQYIVPSFTTYDVSGSYTFDLSDVEMRVLLGIKNLSDERAPVADRFFGFFADAHTDYGRYMYLDLSVKLR